MQVAGVAKPVVRIAAAAPPILSCWDSLGTVHKKNIKWFLTEKLHGVISWCCKHGLSCGFQSQVTIDSQSNVHWTGAGFAVAWLVPEPRCHHASTFSLPKAFCLGPRWVEKLPARRLRQPVCSLFCFVNLSCGREGAAQCLLHFEHWYFLIIQLPLPSSCWLRCHLLPSYMLTSGLFSSLTQSYFPMRVIPGVLVLACFSLYAIEFFYYGKTFPFKLTEWLRQII